MPAACSSLLGTLHRPFQVTRRAQALISQPRAHFPVRLLAMAPGQSSSKRAMHSRKIPVTVVTGFLGSGKTTLVNRILHGSHGKKIAIIENEFGEIGIDDGLIIQSKEEVIEMMNGCICCTVRGDLVKVLNKLLKRKGRFDAILIETTGLADPAPVAQTFFVDESLAEKLQLDAIVTVVDAKHIEQHLDDEKPEGVENESVEQLAFADVILLNKTDLIKEEDKARILKRIKAINSSVEVIPTLKSEVDLNKILGIKGFSLEKVLTMDPSFLDEDGEHQHDERVTSVAFEVEGECDGRRLNAWLSRLLQEKGADLFRSKGILSIHRSPEKYFFQGVHMLLTLGSSAEGVGQGWKPEEKRTNKLVFIGRNLNREELLADFKACII